MHELNTRVEYIVYFIVHELNTRVEYSIFCSARTEHQDALAEDDGKPDLYSRKSCNYLEQAVGVNNNYRIK